MFYRFLIKEEIKLKFEREVHILAGSFYQIMETFSMTPTSIAILDMYSFFEKMAASTSDSQVISK